MCAYITLERVLTFQQSFIRKCRVSRDAATHPRGKGPSKIAGHSERLFTCNFCTEPCIRSHVTSPTPYYFRPRNILSESRPHYSKSFISHTKSEHHGHRISNNWHRHPGITYSQSSLEVDLMHNQPHRWKLATILARPWHAFQSAFRLVAIVLDRGALNAFISL